MNHDPVALCLQFSAVAQLAVLTADDQHADLWSMTAVFGRGKF
jgi:hypothetical protein